MIYCVNFVYVLILFCFFVLNLFPRVDSVIVTCWVSMLEKLKVVIILLSFYIAWILPVLETGTTLSTWDINKLLISKL
jgi:hypothetical protein